MRHSLLGLGGANFSISAWEETTISQHLYSKMIWDLDLNLSVGGQLDLSFSKGFTIIGIGIPVTWSWYMESLPLKFYAKAGPCC